MMSRLKKINGKKGFTLVELLCTILILGILMFMAIAGVSNLIGKAKESGNTAREKTISMATESYLQANRDLLPKSIGEVKYVKVNELRDSEYLKDSIKDSEGNSCMKESYVRVYKFSKTEYIYTPYVYCGDEKAPSEEAVPEPTVVLKFHDGNENSTMEDVLSNVAEARLYMEITGGMNTDKQPLAIDGYSFTISVKQPSDTEVREVYNSGTLSANRETQVIIDKKLTDYIDVTGATYISVKLTVRNVAGGEKSIIISDKSNTATFEDVTPPVCERLQIDVPEGDWVNEEGKSRSVTVYCNDGAGSGCVRDTFSKSWPNDEEEQAEYSWISVKDNAGNTNVTSCEFGTAGCCKVRVNVDFDSPKVTIGAYKATADGKKANNNNLLTKLFVGDSKHKNYLLDVEDYKKDVMDNGWFNAAKYPYGIVYEVKAADNIHLDKFEWKTNPVNSEYGKVDDTLSGFNGSENALGNFANLKEEGFLIHLKDEGFRNGVLKVYDKAQNITKIEIRANIDYTAPILPPITNSSAFSAVRIKEGSPDVEMAGGNYNVNSPEWSRHYVRANFNKSYNRDNADGIDLSGFSRYEYTFTNQDKAKASGTTTDYFTIHSTGNKSVTNVSKGIKIEGKNKIIYRICDKANNCSGYSPEGEVWIDTVAPSCSVTGGGEWTNQPVTIYGTCVENNNPYGSGCNESKNISHTYTEEMDIKNGGAINIGEGGQIEDIAGNVTKCEANRQVRIDTTAPTCETKVNTVWTKNNALVYYKCKDNGKGSGCAGKLTDDHKSVGQGEYVQGYEKNWNLSMKSVSVPKWTTRDNAGNKTECAAKTLDVKVDKTAPTYDSGGKISGSKLTNAKYSDSHSGVRQNYYCFKGKTPSDSDSCWKTSPIAAPTACNSTYYGYVKSVDQVGNSTPPKLMGAVTNGPCCSETNWKGCDWVTSCRKGNTYIYRNSKLLNGSPYAGTVKHKNPGDDKLYVINNNVGSGAYVYAASGDFYSPTQRNVYIYRNCINPIGDRNKVCSFSQCPDLG